MTTSRLRFGPRLLQLYFVLGLLLLAGVWFVYSQSLLLRLSRLWTGYAQTLSEQLASTMSGQLESSTQLKARIYGKFMSRAAEVSESGSPELDIIFDEVIQRLDFPVVICDAEGRPVARSNVSDADTSRSDLDSLVRQMDREHEPIRVTLPGDTTRLLSVIHYGISPSTQLLRTMCASLASSAESLRSSVGSLRVFSLLQLLLLLGFVAVGVWGILAYTRREQEHIWTALAKETAHQMATPLSSFSAWLEMLRARGGADLVDEMEQDLGRMREVLDRFSRIGQPPELAPHRVAELVQHSVEFVRRRAPKNVRLAAEIHDDPLVRVDVVLFAWTIENLLRNSIDALRAREGEVRVRTVASPDRRWLEIEVVDTGEGVRVDRPFEPGVTSKRHGWGVGLTLARRIVEGYHRGRLVLKESRPGRTVFSILLPSDEPGRPGREG